MKGSQDRYWVARSFFFEANSMNLVVNGELYKHDGQGSIADLLAECRADPSRVAIMINGKMTSRSRWGDVKLAEGDRLELLMFAGGG